VVRSINKSNIWYFEALTCILLSFLFLFFPILSFNGSNYYLSDTLFGMQFAEDVLTRYRGNVIWDIGAVTTSILTVLFIVCYIAAISGIMLMRKQVPSRFRFCVTIIGMLGIIFPSVLVIVCTVFLRKNFDGFIRCGISPIAIPFVMILCVCIVSAEYKKQRQTIQRLIQNGLFHTDMDL